MELAGSDLYEQVKKADFNRTEPETLKQLVDAAIQIGEEIKQDYVRLRQLTDEALALLKKEDVIRERKFDAATLQTISEKPCSASDGSFQSVGGADGIWYVPISAALISFMEGLWKGPKATVGAKIIRIDERQHMNLGAAMETSMLYAEAGVIKDWACQCPVGIVHLIDGPIIDPPRQMDSQYIAYRTEAIKACLEKKLFVLGCVKKPLGNFLLERLSESLREIENERLSQFSSDAYMIFHVFTKVSLDNSASIYTRPMEISNSNPLYKPYLKAGLRIYFMYFQRELRSKPFRVDIPMLEGTELNMDELGEKAAATLSAWSYPGYDLPIPIVLADNKCNIRKGCAEVLYSEIITRAASDNLLDNLVRIKLSEEVS